MKCFKRCQKGPVIPAVVLLWLAIVFNGCYVKYVNDSYDRVSGYNVEFVKNEQYHLHHKKNIDNALLLFDDPPPFSAVLIGYLKFRKILPSDFNETLYKFIRHKAAVSGGDIAVIKRKSRIGNELYVDIYAK